MVRLHWEMPDRRLGELWSPWMKNCESLNAVIETLPAKFFTTSDIDIFCLPNLIYIFWSLKLLKVSSSFSSYKVLNSPLFGFCFLTPSFNLSSSMWLRDYEMGHIYLVLPVFLVRTHASPQCFCLDYLLAPSLFSI